jgi:hypothetical protein
MLTSYSFDVQFALSAPALLDSLNLNTQTFSSTNLQEIRGSFDEAGQLELSSQAYWDLLEAQLEKHTQVKHVSMLL